MYGLRADRGPAVAARARPPDPERRRDPRPAQGAGKRKLVGLRPRLWQRLADAGISGIAVPEAHGGGGLGFLELATVFEEVGRTVAPVPAVPTLVTAYALARHGKGNQVLSGVADGTTILTTAFEGEVLVTREDGGWVLDGETPFVPFGAEADVVV